MRIQSRLIAVTGVLVISGWALADSRPQIALDANSLTIKRDGNVLLQYRYGDVAFKPYIKELFSPSGLNVLLDSPPDHVHHHALMFACAVNGIDFWAEYAGRTPDRASGQMAATPGKQEHTEFDEVGIIDLGGQPWARFAERVNWIAPAANESAILEHRVITAGRFGEPPATFLTWECEISVPPGRQSVVLSGSHYHGLGLRFIRPMDANGEFRNRDDDPGAIYRGEERLLRSNWCAYTADAGGRTATLAMFGHPDNPRHPTTWFTMPRSFAYISATLGLHEQPLEVPAGRPLRLRYGVALWDGRPTDGQIDGVYEKWITIGKTASER